MISLSGSPSALVGSNSPPASLTGLSEPRSHGIKLDADTARMGVEAWPQSGGVAVSRLLRRGSRSSLSSSCWSGVVLATAALGRTPPSFSYFPLGVVGGYPHYPPDTGGHKTQK